MPVLSSATDLLTHADRRRVRRCANDQCLWVFVDESKAGTRRWCDMASCGNRAKITPPLSEDEGRLSRGRHR